MNQIILATHGGLADGMRDTLSMVLGDASNVHVISLARDDKDPITSKVQALIDSFDPADKVYVCTDMLGSSVNNEMVALGAANEKLTIIAGMNMPFVIELAAAVEPLTNEELVELIKASREGLRDCSANPVVVAGAATPAKKARAAASAGPAKINLVRLDYRLLHGQVVFSWVTKVGAERIIVVDNDAAGDDVKKSALRLAKPSGVRLNVFTVERALAKMAKLNTLGENVMFVFGNTRELLEFHRQPRRRRAGRRLRQLRLLRRLAEGGRQRAPQDGCRALRPADAHPEARRHHLPAEVMKSDSPFSSPSPSATERSYA